MKKIILALFALFALLYGAASLALPQSFVSEGEAKLKKEAFETIEKQVRERFKNLEHESTRVSLVYDDEFKENVWVISFFAKAHANPYYSVFVSDKLAKVLLESEENFMDWKNKYVSRGENERIDLWAKEKRLVFDNIFKNKYYECAEEEGDIGEEKALSLAKEALTCEYSIKNKAVFKKYSLSLVKERFGEDSKIYIVCFLNKNGESLYQVNIDSKTGEILFSVNENGRDNHG